MEPHSCIQKKYIRNVYLAFVMRQPGARTDGSDDIFVYAEKFYHFNYLPIDSFVMEETLPMIKDAVLWVDMWAHVPGDFLGQYKFFRIEPGSHMRPSLVN